MDSVNAETVPLILESFERALTDIGAADALANASASDEGRRLVDEAARWDLAWAFHRRRRQQPAAIPTTIRRPSWLTSSAGSEPRPSADLARVGT